MPRRSKTCTQAGEEEAVRCDERTSCEMVLLGANNMRRRRKDGVTPTFFVGIERRFTGDDAQEAWARTGKAALKESSSWCQSHCC